MTQVVKKLKPVTVNTDTSKYDLKESESPFLRGYDISVAKDANSNEGGNFGVGKKISSNFQTIAISLPTDGVNKTIGFYEAEELNEAYVFNWNSKNNHGIYRLDGVKLISEPVVIRPGLNFSIDPRYAIPPHRVSLRVVYGIDDNGERIVIEKYLIYTDGNNWQRWITVIAAIATNGFDATAFPYYTLQPPHFDADELIDCPVRPPLYAPVILPVTPTADDISEQNFLLEKSIQFCYRGIMTDGRPTALSWFSTPYFAQPVTCDVNNTSLPRCLDLSLYALSPHVEQLQILIRYNGISSTNGVAENSDWELYDTINKFSTSGDNSPDIIGNEYWRRTNPWADYNYNPDDNIILYRFCGDKGTTIYTDDAAIVQNDIPLKSAALTEAGDVIIWADNLRFYPNFTDDVLDNISLDVVDGDQTDGCTLKTVKISLYSTFDSGAVSFKAGPSDTQRYFCRGKYNITNQSVSFLVTDSEQLGLKFGNNDGFICYLAGTSYYAIGKQKKVDRNGVISELGVVDNTNTAQMQSIFELYQNGGYVFMQYDFEVPQGFYVARLANQGVTVTVPYENSSTYVLGVAKNDQLYINPKNGFLPDKEIRIDATAGDVDTWTSNKNIFYIHCPIWPKTTDPRNLWFIGPLEPVVEDHFRNIEGYLRDNIDGIDGVDADTHIGVEFVNYYPGLGDPAKKITGTWTDHNGFFFVYTAGDDRADDSEVNFDGGFNCGPKYPNLFQTQINTNNKSGWFPGQVINIGDVNSSQGNYVLYTGRVVSCISGNGISSVGVTFANGRTNYTDADGYWSLRVHTIGTNSRMGRIFFNGNGNCVFSSCDCGVIPTTNIDTTAIPCSNSLRPAPALPDLKLNTLIIKGASMKGGGRYPVTINGHDFAGRKTAACLIGYISVPTFLEKGNFKTSKIRVTITKQIKFPKDIKWVTFSVGNNVNTTTYLQWVGDKIEYLDNQGNITGDGSGAIRARITIQSLLDFNIRENFNTTASYQFVQGDRVTIYDDGQGNLFTPSANSGFLDYPVLGTNFDQTVDPTTTVTTTTDGTTTSTATTKQAADPKAFIIEFDERLLPLKDSCGFWIELHRLVPQNDNEPVFGVSGTYPVIDGVLDAQAIILEAFDTFFQRRNIVITGCSSANFNHPFESQSITDYWGDNVTSAGMVLFKDPQAQQRWYLNDAIKTDAFVNLGRVNGLGFCRTTNRKDFKDQSWGGIVAMHAERNIIVFVCQNDWFTADFQLNYAHVDEYGRVIANPDLSTGIGNPYQKVGDNFGCEFEDVSTIQFVDGLGIWADRKNSGIIVMNYKQAFDISTVDNKGYFTNKFKFLTRFNQSIGNDVENIMETSLAVNPNNNQIYVSFRPRNGLSSSPVDFVNNERGVIYSSPETFIYNLTLKKWVGWAPFVPEYYGTLKHAQSGTEFIAFCNGAAWFHNSKNITGFMNFFGVDTDQVVNVVSNFDQSKLKIYQSIGIESAQVKYFISKVITDAKGSFSYVPLAYFKKKGNVLYAELLRDMNTYPNPSRPVVSMLQDGKSITGEYAEFQLVSDPETSSQYSEINNILVRFIGSEKSEK